MKILSVLWSILGHLASVAVVLAMFHIAKSSFETIAVSGLVLIYTSVVGYFSLLGGSLLEKGQQDLARFIQLAKSLSLNTEIYEEALKEDQDGIKKHQVNVAINSIFYGLIALIAIGNLVYAVAKQAL